MSPRSDVYARTYSAEERAEAVALAASIGPLRAGDTLGIPRRTVASWMHTPAAGPIIAAAEANIAERLTEAHRVALEAVLSGLAEPTAKLGDRARALEVLGNQAALAEGRATARTESMNLSMNVNVNAATWEQLEEARRYTASLLEQLDAGGVDEVEEAVSQGLQFERHMRELEADGIAATPAEAVEMMRVTVSVLTVLRRAHATRQELPDAS